MKLSVVEYICQNYSKTWGIPIGIYINGKLYKKYERVSFDSDLAAKFYEQMKSVEKNMSILLTPKYLVYVMIKIKHSDIVIIAGPGRSVELDDAEIRSLLSDNELHIHQFEDFKTYLQSIRLLPVEQFITNLAVLNAGINDEVEVIDIFNTEFLQAMYGVDLSDYQDIINSRYNNQMEYDPDPHYDFEKKLLFLIRNGMVDRLEGHLTSFVARPTSITADAFRQFKDRCISSTTLISREAIKGGVPIDISYRLFDSYCKKIENSTSVQQLNSLSVNMMFDYSKRVREHQFKETDNPTLNRVIGYISRHLDQRLSVSIIANEFNMNSGYLSYRFKKDTGQSLSAFINQQKINEAKSLLRFTDKKLSEISADLSFSTQSYFQNVFRKYTGITPLEYRQKSDNKT